MLQRLCITARWLRRLPLQRTAVKARRTWTVASECSHPPNIVELPDAEPLRFRLMPEPDG